MLNLSATCPGLDTFHQRFQDEGLPRELSRKAFAGFDPSRYDGEVLDYARGAWQLRVLDEYRSQVGFTELLMELTDVGFGWDVLGTCVRVVRDESRHVEICRRMVKALGGDDLIPGEPAYVRSDKDLPLLTRVVETLVSSLCIGETFSVRLLAAVRDRTRDPLAKAAMTQLAADESIHSRFGWELLELLAPHLGEAERAHAASVLPGVFAACEQIVIQPACDDGGAAALARLPSENPFGFIDDAERDAVFFKSLEKDILARFDKVDLGFSARAAWDARPKS